MTEQERLGIREIVLDTISQEGAAVEDLAEIEADDVTDETTVPIVTFDVSGNPSGYAKIRISSLLAHVNEAAAAAEEAAEIADTKLDVITDTEFNTIFPPTI